MVSQLCSMLCSIVPAESVLTLNAAIENPSSLLRLGGINKRYLTCTMGSLLASNLSLYAGVTFTLFLSTRFVPDVFIFDIDDQDVLLSRTMEMNEMLIDCADFTRIVRFFSKETSEK